MKIQNWPLIPFSLLYGAGIFLRNAAYNIRLLKTQKVEVPVISVGNISAGGTGKTPVSEFLLSFLMECGLRPAYLSRGYGRASKGFFIVPPQGGTSAQFGDEARQVAAKFPTIPVAVCEDRVAGASQLIGLGVEVIVLDDAYQHRAIARDCNIAVLDASRLPWQDFLLPAGRLREPQSALQRADFVWVNKIADGQATEPIAKRLPDKPLGFTRIASRGIFPFFAQSPEVQISKETEIVGFSGLGNNDQFVQTLKGLGGNLKGFHAFPDHHDYSQAEITKILGNFTGNPQNSGNFAPALYLTTEKDYFRLKGQGWLDAFASTPLYYVKIGLEWQEGRSELETLIKQAIGINS